MIDEFKVIGVMNKAMLKTLKDKNKDFTKNEKIKEFLEDESCFFKIDKTKALRILQYVGVKQDQLENVYEKLTTPNKYYDLVNKGIIDIDDQKLVVKYKNYRL